MRIPHRIALSLEYHLFKKKRALLARILPASIQTHLRRQTRAAFLLWEARPYRAWMNEHLRHRAASYTHEAEPGLLSVLTAVWNGSPVQYLTALANSVICQNESGNCEWIILDNGCTNRELLGYLETLKQYPWIQVHRAEENLGIVCGLRLCLERAKGAYILPVDADDRLYPDCFRVVASWIHKAGFPPLLYTDEDKIIGSQATRPYLKPDFDPVLLLNSAYIAHLGIIDREAALKLDAYSDPNVEGSPDWDLFVRFLLAGQTAVHIPEIVYSWRIHSDSTAEDVVHKHYVQSSQRAVLQRYLDFSSRSNDYSVEYSPLLGGSVDWWLRRRHEKARPMLIVLLSQEQSSPDVIGRQVDYPGVHWASLSISSRPEALLDLIAPGVDRDGCVCLLSRDLQIDRGDWAWEAVALIDLHPDTIMVGGRIRNRKGIITAAGYVLGFDGNCGCPDRGRSAIEYGYFTQMFKQHSVSAVSTQFAILRATFLRDLLENGIYPESSIPFLGAWAGAYALRAGKRVVYSPFLSAMSDVDWDRLTGSQEKEIFRERNKDILPDHRFYPRYFSLKRESPYQFTKSPHFGD